MIDLTNPNAMRKLAKAVEFAFTDQSPERERRNSLVRIFADQARDWYSEFFGDNWYNSSAQYLPLFQQYVRGHLMALAYTNPKWDVRSKKIDGRQFAARMRLLLDYYFDILDGQKLVRQWGLDTAFGDAVAKIVDGPPPLGITAPIAPRVYRLNPNMVIRDRSAECVEDCGFIGDLYLMPIDEAMNNPEFLMHNALGTMNLRPYRVEGDAARDITTSRTSDAYPEEVVRLLDLYIPKVGLCTFDVPNDSFSSLSLDTMLRVKRTSINPYEFCRLVTMPDNVGELARLYYLKQLSFLANDMLAKAAAQARHSKRNPISKIGNEHDLSHALDAPDNEPVFLNEMDQHDLFVLPGPDPTVLELGTIASRLFSQQAGNTETALGISPGATTARQTQAMLGQIEAASDYDRSIFETFLSRVGQKLATLAFESDVLELEFQQRVPGTKYSYPVYWGPPASLPRVGEITDFLWDVVPYSTAYRSPSTRLAQLQQASTGIAQWMGLASQGAPLNLAAIMKSYAEAFDQVPELAEWWSGEQPSPQEATAQTYVSAMPHQPGGSQINYQGVAGGDEQNTMSLESQPQQ